MKNNRTFKSLPTYGEIESGLYCKPVVMKSVCPKCGSDRWIKEGEFCECTECMTMFKQTVL